MQFCLTETALKQYNIMHNPGFDAPFCDEFVWLLEWCRDVRQFNTDALPDAVKRTLEVPAAWVLVAYCCIGYPVEESKTPELVKPGGQDRPGDCRKVPGK